MCSPLTSGSIKIMKSIVYPLRYFFARRLNTARDRSICSVGTQQEMRTCPGQPKLLPGTRRRSIFWAARAKATSSSSRLLGKRQKVPPGTTQVQPRFLRLWVRMRAFFSQTERSAVRSQQAGCSSASKIELLPRAIYRKSTGKRRRNSRSDFWVTCGAGVTVEKAGLHLTDEAFDFHRYLRGVEVHWGFQWRSQKYFPGQPLWLADFHTQKVPVLLIEFVPKTRIPDLSSCFLPIKCCFLCRFFCSAYEHFKRFAHIIVDRKKLLPLNQLLHLLVCLL